MLRLCLFKYHVAPCVYSYLLSASPCPYFQLRSSRSSTICCGGLRCGRPPPLYLASSWPPNWILGCCWPLSLSCGRSSSLHYLLLRCSGSLLGLNGWDFGIRQETAHFYILHWFLLGVLEHLGAFALDRFLRRLRPAWGLRLKLWRDRLLWLFLLLTSWINLQLGGCRSRRMRNWCWLRYPGSTNILLTSSRPNWCIRVVQHLRWKIFATLESKMLLLLRCRMGINTSWLCV